VSVYSSGAIGRLMPEDVLGMVRHLKARAADEDASGNAEEPGKAFDGSRNKPDDG